MKLLTHVDDAVRHRLDVVAPFREEFRVVEDEGDLSGNKPQCEVTRPREREREWRGGREREEGTHNPRTIGRRRRNLLPLNNQQLTLNALRSSLDVPRMGGNEVKSTDTLTVETGVLGVRLADEEGDLARDEVPDGPGVVVEVARGEALPSRRKSAHAREKGVDEGREGKTHLVSAIKESVVTLLLKDLGNLLPLVPCGVHPRRVVRARVEEEDRLARCGAKEVEELGEGESDVVGVVVGVVDGSETDRVEDRLVVRCG